MDVIPNFTNDCFAHPRKVLNFIGFSTNTGFLKTIYAISLLIILTIYPFTVISEIIKLRNNFDELIHSVIFVMGCFIGLITAHCLYWKRFTLHKLFDKMQVLSDVAKSVNNKEDYQLIQNYENFVRKQGYSGSILPILVILGPTVVAALISIKKKHWVLPFGSGIFIDNGAIKFIFQTSTFFINAIVVYLGLFIYINMLALLSAHCQHLQKFIRSILNSAPSSESTVKGSWNNICQAPTTSISWRIFKIKLKIVVDYHTTIIKRSSELETIFYLFMLSFFVGVSVSICCLLYHLQTLPVGDINLFNESLFIVTCFILLVIFAFWEDQVLISSSGISSACYEVDWIGPDIIIQKSLLLIQMQMPIKLTIGKVRVLYLPTMVGVLQSMYSYYTFLRDVKSK